jgi:hypothetical protein
MGAEEGMAALAATVVTALGEGMGPLGMQPLRAEMAEGADLLVGEAKEGKAAVEATLRWRQMTSCWRDQFH